MFLWNLLLALAWAALTGEFSLLNLSLGLGFGFAILSFVGPAMGTTKYFAKARALVGFAAFFAREVVRSNLRVALDVVTPRLSMRPGIIAVPLDARTDAEITIVSNLIALTPGTLSLDLSEDGRVLFLHAMHVDDPDALRREIKDGFERRVLELMR